MAAFTGLFGVLPVQEFKLRVAVADVRLMTVNTGRRVGITRLPLTEKGVEMAVHVTRGRDIRMALQAVGIANRLGQRRRLHGGVERKSQEIAGAQAHGRDAAAQPWPGMAINAAR